VVSAGFPSDARRGPDDPDEERIAEIKLLFSEQGCKMFAPRQLRRGDSTGTWVVRYVRKEVYGDVMDVCGTGVTALEATEDALAKFQADQRKGQISRLLEDRPLGH
jgi:hypothetical protein